MIKLLAPPIWIFAWVAAGIWLGGGLFLAGVYYGAFRVRDWGVRQRNRLGELTSSRLRRSSSEHRG